MKKSFVYLIIASLILTTAYADLSDFPGNFLDGGAFEGYIVVGDKASATDVISQSTIALKIGSIVTVPNFRISKLASEVDLENNLILVGNPCVNELTAKLLNNPEPCDKDFPKGKAFIIYTEEETYKYIIVAGSNDQETKEAANTLANYDNYNLYGDEIEIELTSEEEFEETAIENSKKNIAPDIEESEPEEEKAEEEKAEKNEGQAISNVQEQEDNSLDLPEQKIIVKEEKGVLAEYGHGLQVGLGEKMITQKEIKEVLDSYDTGDLTIGVLGGHSALDICRGAKKYGFRTVAVCQKGREKTYSKYYRSRGDKGIVDEIILVDDFKDIVKADVQKQLRDMNTIFIHNRYFWVYCNFEQIEEKFKVPIFGTRTLLKLEERDVPKNQYYQLEKAGIKIPKIFNKPKEIDRLVIVKVNEAERGYERAFFFASSPETYEDKSKEMLKKKTITEKALKDAVIEEFIVGAQVNFNYFYSPLDDELELMGTDTRRQTNLDGLIRLPADQQLEVLKHVEPKIIETGHISVTTKESILEKIFDLGEKFVSSLKKEHPPGIIGPFALQGAISAEKGKETPVIFDVSFRIPGSPGTAFTPYSGYLHQDSISYGERVAMEIRKARDDLKLDLICT